MDDFHLKLPCCHVTFGMPNHKKPEFRLAVLPQYLSFIQEKKLLTASITISSSASVSSGYMGRDTTSFDICSVIGKLK